jgi:hypothetical protein
VGKSGTASDVIENVLTDASLLAIPSAYVNVPVLTDTLNGAIQTKVEGTSLLEQVLDEAHCHGFWTWDGIFKVVLRPARSALTDAVHTFTSAFAPPQRKMKDLGDLVNSIEAKYNWDWIEGTYADSTVRESAASQTKYSKVAKDEVSYKFITGQSAAEDLTDIIVSYLEECFQEVSIQVGVVGLNMEPSDIVGVVCDEVKASKVELKEVRFLGIDGDVLTVELKGVKYA